MRTLVLGGSVFVGRHTVQALLDDGHEVSVLNRGKTASDLPASVGRLVADRTDIEAMRQVLEGTEWDAVFDVSGFVMAAGGVDVPGLLDLFEGRVGHYVYVSSVMAYDQDNGVFPWTEDAPTNPDGPGTYGGFKALVETELLARHRDAGFPASVVRPAAIYGPDNNIFDMETPMFLRLLQHRPIVVPHGGLVVCSYGHVDDLCRCMVELVGRPEALGEVFNVTTEAVTVDLYVRTLADVVGVEPDVVYLPDDVLATLDQRPFGHLFGRAHHAAASTEKMRHVLGFQPSFDLRSGHEDTYAWFLKQGLDDVDRALVDPVWKASWDFDHEAAVAARLR